MELRIEPKERYFIVRISGHVTNQDLLDCIEAVGETAKWLSLTRVLLDEREASHGSDTYDAYQAGESKYIETAAMLGYRIATVPSPENIKKNKAFETMMLNRSVHYRVFDTLEDAEAWLLG